MEKGCPGSRKDAAAAAVACGAAAVGFAHSGAEDTVSVCVKGKDVRCIHVSQIPLYGVILLFRQAVLESKREKAARAERILDLVAQFCGADKCDYDGIENAVSERNFERCRRNDMEYRLERWQKESEEVKQTYPQFDLAKEMSDRRFFSLCYKGVGLEEAYLIVHKDELFTAAMEYAASELMRSGAFCKSGRMKEGALSSAGEVTKSEKSLSKNERKELIRRTERGERVVL